MKTILVLASNPTHDLKLETEIEHLKGVIDRSKYRDQFKVITESAVRVKELQEFILSREPQIVHFCGHGTQQGLVLQNDFGEEQLIAPDALSDLFAVHNESSEQKIECVLLNACYSEEQTDAIVEHVNYAIGMNREIRDDSAIAFSTGFYLALAHGRSIEQSYKFGCNAIKLNISGNSTVRSGMSEEERKLKVISTTEEVSIPEDLKPVLKIKPGLPPIDSKALTDEHGLPSHLRQQSIQLDVAIDKALDEEKQYQEYQEKLQRYRENVREFLTDHKLTELELIRLKQLQKSLDLSDEESECILEEEQEPIRKAQEEYREILTHLAQNAYPFDHKNENELEQLSQALGLTDIEIEEISEPILESAEASYRKRLRQITIESKTVKVATVNADGQLYEQKPPVIEYYVQELGSGISLELVIIPSGEFLMGSPSEEKRDLNEELAAKLRNAEIPQHQVSIQSFAIGKYPVTQVQWRVVATLFQKVNIDLEPDPSHFKGKNRPVEQISWLEAVEFCDRLSRRTGRTYRLPSEAEWEYACRAGTETPFHFGQTITTDLANYKGQEASYSFEPRGICLEETTPMNHFEFANAFGLCDMHGNVWEWCLDDWHDNYDGASSDGTARRSEHQNPHRPLRGGSWRRPPGQCRSAVRVATTVDNRSEAIGFRVACQDLPDIKKPETSQTYLL